MGYFHCLRKPGLKSKLQILQFVDICVITKLGVMEKVAGIPGKKSIKLRSKNGEFSRREYPLSYIRVRISTDLVSPLISCSLPATW
jgi:hypothetical protein